MLIPSNDILLVGLDYNQDKDNMVIIVGRKTPNGAVDVVNAFQGEEAKELYKRLVTKAKEATDNGEGV